MGVPTPDGETPWEPGASGEGGAPDPLDDPDASAEEESPASVDPPGVRRRLCGKQPPTGWYAYLGTPAPDEETPWEPNESAGEDAPFPQAAPPPAEQAVPADEPSPPPGPCGDVTVEAFERQVKLRVDNPLDDSDGSLWEEPDDDGCPPVAG